MAVVLLYELLRLFKRSWNHPQFSTLLCIPNFIASEISHAIPSVPHLFWWGVGYSGLDHVGY
jgi:hypothetical protein